MNFILPTVLLWQPCSRNTQSLAVGVHEAACPVINKPLDTIQLASGTSLSISWYPSFTYDEYSKKARAKKGTDRQRDGF